MSAITAPSRVLKAATRLQSRSRCPSASCDDCCRPILNFSTNSANGSYQGTAAARPENRQGRLGPRHEVHRRGAVVDLEPTGAIGQKRPDGQRPRDCGGAEGELPLAQHPTLRRVLHELLRVLG